MLPAGWARSGRARVVGALAGLLLLSAWAELSGRIHLGWERVPLRGIYHEIGHAYLSPLSTSRWSAIGGASAALVVESDRPLGPGNAVHDEIRKLGRGRFSFWGEHVYLSASDNSDAATNGRRYEAWGPGRASTILRNTVFGLGGLSACYLMLWLAASARVRLPGPGLASKTASRWYRNKTLWTVFLVVAATSIVPLTLEVGLRLTAPTFVTAWPSVFDPDVGFHFVPRAEVRHTNHVDFWTTSRANSLGFLDKEPPSPERRGCHVTFIGDSFVEAAQVAIPEKFQRLIEDDARKRHPEWDLTTSAFGFSGTGQLNQLPFYDKYARGLSPRLVVLVVVSNDFANNSGILEALRNGWSPDAPPRVFARRGDGDQGFVLEPIAKDWNERRLPDLPPPDPRSVHSRLKVASHLYRRAMLTLSARFPSVAALDGPTLGERVLFRAKGLRADAKNAYRFKGWEDRFAADLDRPFLDDPLPELYAEAWEATRFAFEEFKRRAVSDGAQVAILTASQLTAADPQQRMVGPLKRMAGELHIPIIEQYGFIVQKGGDPKKVRFRYDNHWNLVGHQFAAQAVMEHLEQNPTICQPAARP